MPELVMAGSGMIRRLLREQAGRWRPPLLCRFLGRVEVPAVLVVRLLASEKPAQKRKFTGANRLYPIFLFNSMV